LSTKNVQGVKERKLIKGESNVSAINVPFTYFPDSIPELVSLKEDDEGSLVFHVFRINWIGQRSLYL
jgi:hypothetical protein